MGYKIAVITPKNKNDYLTDTVIDGLLDLKSENGDLEFCLPDSYPTDLAISEYKKNERDFIDFTKVSDLIIYCWGKDNTNYELAENVNKFDKTVFVDGSEIGKNGRHDVEIQKAILNGTYEGRGRIDLEMEKKCALYLRREKPYLRNIIPFPFGIERKYRKYYSKDTKKDIDFVCIFGQDEYPSLRKEVRRVLADFCMKEGFSFVTKQTNFLFLNIYSSFAKKRFYKTLARAKVGISVSGSGFDTARFWEILGNNCLLLTENIDIYEPNSLRLKYERIWQFKDLNEFKEKLNEMGKFLRSSYGQKNMEEEYKSILLNHSSKSRVLEILEKAKEKGIIA